MSNANAGQTMGIATSSSYSSDGLLLGMELFLADFYDIKFRFHQIYTKIEASKLNSF